MVGSAAILLKMLLACLGVSFGRNLSEAFVNIKLEQTLSEEVAQGSAASGPLCAKEGFPLCGVQYVPHMVGSPFVKSVGKHVDMYHWTYQNLHRRDLPLIKKLGADTLRLRPWNVDAYESTRWDFFDTCKDHVKKVIPTFKLSDHYADMVRVPKSEDGEHEVLPATTGISPLYENFHRFISSVEDIKNKGLELSAWSLDLSLDLDDLADFSKELHQVEGKLNCSGHEPVWNNNYLAYKNLLLGILKWVKQTGKGLQDVPLLLPLDISRLHAKQASRAASSENLKSFLDCMSEWGASWYPPLFDFTKPRTNNRWLWSISVPAMTLPGTETNYKDFVEAKFKEELKELVKKNTASGKDQAAAVVMVGVSAVKPNPRNQAMMIEDHVNAKESKYPTAMSHIMEEIVKQYQELRQTAELQLDGFIVDEWQDNWDRGTQGPFVFATDKLDAMIGDSDCDRNAGSRFYHDAENCRVPLKESNSYPEFLGLAGSTSKWLDHCVQPRLRKRLFPQEGSNSEAVLDGGDSIKCAHVMPEFFACSAALLLTIVIVLFHLFHPRISPCWASCKKMCGRMAPGAPRTKTKASASLEEPLLKLDEEDQKEKEAAEAAANQAKTAKEKAKEAAKEAEEAKAKDLEAATEECKAELKSLNQPADVRSSVTMKKIDEALSKAEGLHLKPDKVPELKDLQDHKKKLEEEPPSDLKGEYTPSFPWTDKCWHKHKDGDWKYYPGDSLESHLYQNIKSKVYYVKNDGAFQKIKEKDELVTKMKQSEEERKKSAEMPKAEMDIQPQIELLDTKPFAKISVKSSRFKDKKHAKLWLTFHLEAQRTILENQVKIAMLDVEAVGARKNFKAGQDADVAVSVEGEEDHRSTVSKAMEIVWTRCLQGYHAWNQNDPDPRSERGPPMGAHAQLKEDKKRYAEALVLRTMESLGEHILHSPERLSYYLHQRILETREDRKKPYEIDLDEVFDGVDKMNEHSNPLKKNEQGELGLNFDDINESGIQKRTKVTKTFKERSSIFVFIDIILCYRSVFFVKLWVFLLAWYCYLGSDTLGTRDEDTSPLINGELFKPRWLRLDFIKYSALLDASLWFMTAFLHLVYVFCGSRKQYLSWPENRWQKNTCGKYLARQIVQHVLVPGCMIVVFVVSMIDDLLHNENAFPKLPASCAEFEKECADPRLKDMTMEVIGGYWVVTYFNFYTGYWGVRLLSFVFFNSRFFWIRRPIFLFGKAKARKNGCCQKIVSPHHMRTDLQATLCWVCMLVTCWAFEYGFLLPISNGMDWEEMCGVPHTRIKNPLSAVPFLKQIFTGATDQFLNTEPPRTSDLGPCSDAQFFLTSSCVPCISSIGFVWVLIVIGVCLDIYFVFYFFSAVVGGLMMSLKRKLNSLKMRQTIHLAENGEEAKLLENTLGPKWRPIFAMIVKSLFEDSLLDEKVANMLVDAAGVDLEGNVTNPPPPSNPIDLKSELQDSELALERLAFFFNSLPWLTNNPSLQGRAFDFDTRIDPITADGFQPGSIPSLTQIIPCFHETVIPSRAYLQEGGNLEHARNQPVSGKAGRVGAPKGDGRNPNLGFIISQFPEEWKFLAKRLKEDPKELYLAFMRLPPEGTPEGAVVPASPASPGSPASLEPLVLNSEQENKIRLWAAMRTQSVAKTVIGALEYHKALEALPGVKNVEDHVELLLAHQVFGRVDGHKSNDEAVKLLMTSFKSPSFYLVFDVEFDETKIDVDPKKGSKKEVRKLVMDFFHKKQKEAKSMEISKKAAEDKPVEDAKMAEEKPAEEKEGEEKKKGRKEEEKKKEEEGTDPAGIYHLTDDDIQKIKHWSCKCRMNENGELEAVQVIPRFFPLLIGQDKYKTQGKAANQLNALRFASGYYLQAMDCNMGVFMGEAFKIPYVLRLFVPLDREDRSEVLARFIGFREYIFTRRDGRVGQLHADAEWTFGTIYQRFLSFMSSRMHYGHPDFMDGFWARNRGGMSKASPLVNLSEDLFAGYNVRMREEDSPHTDFLEFEKGREVHFNSASAFTQKISGGCMAMLRSRDNQIICERIGLLHGLSYYFSSVAFYISNLLIDCATYIYMLTFLSFTLSSVDLGRLGALSNEWIITVGVVSMIPQLVESILEYDPLTSLGYMLRGFISSTLFWIFQNKNVAFAMRSGSITGVSKYFATGRPIANQHQTWKDNYCFYWKSHYHPAFNLALLYYCYLSLNEGVGHLPMFWVAISFVTWLIAPVLFSPFPCCDLLQQDTYDFRNFILGDEGWRDDPKDIETRVEKSEIRNLLELGLADEWKFWRNTPFWVLLIFLMARVALFFGILAVLHAEILDFAKVFLSTFAFQWFLVMLWFVAGLKNAILLLSTGMWMLVPWFGSWVLGERTLVPSIWRLLPEYLIGFVVFLYFLGTVKRIKLFVCRCLFEFSSQCCCRCYREWFNESWLQKAVRVSYLYYFEHQLNVIRALGVLLINLFVTLVLMAWEGCYGLHTLWLFANPRLYKASKINAATQEHTRHVDFLRSLLE